MNLVSTRFCAPSLLSVSRLVCRSQITLQDSRGWFSLTCLHSAGSLRALRAQGSFADLGSTTILFLTDRKFSPSSPPLSRSPTNPPHTTTVSFPPPKLAQDGTHVSPSRVPATLSRRLTFLSPQGTTPTRESPDRPSPTSARRPAGSRSRLTRSRTTSSSSRARVLPPPRSVSFSVTRTVLRRSRASLVTRSSVS